MVQFLSYFRFYTRTGFLLVFFILCNLVKGQYYNLGQDPSSISWRQIKTDHFRMIYPSEFEKKAQLLSNLFEYMYDFDTRTLAHKPKRFPIIIHNRDIIPNAFSLWAPKRIELYTCPPQNTYSQDWLEQLAIHEYRHIVQMDMVNHGFTRGINWFLGEQATALLTGLYVPMWFMEGDAVCAETALSHSGRGRVPSFEMEIRAQVLQKGFFSYDKAVLGSYKDHIPDQYILGYQLVANTRQKYGYQAWIKTMDYIARKPYSMTPFNRGLKNATGKGKVELYRETLTELDSLWRIQSSKTYLSKQRIITKGNSSVYSKYKYPHYVNDSAIIAERTTLDDISRFVLIDKQGNEKVICTPGFFSTDVFSVNIGLGMSNSDENKPGVLTIDNLSINKGLMVWTEREADPRWQNRNYSIIKIYNFSTDKIRALTHKSRLFVPSLAPDGKSLVAVKVTEGNEYSIVQIELGSEGKEKCLLTSTNDLFLTPSWSDNGKKIVYMVLNQHGKGIYSFDIQSGIIKQELAPSFNELSNPKYVGKYILFNGAFSGIANVFAIDTANHSLFQVTSSEFGASDPDYSNARNTMIYSDYSASGFQLAETDFDPASWIPISEVSDKSIGLYKHLLTEEKGMVDSTVITKQKFESKPYPKISHLFNFHSWAPVYFNYEKSEAAAGISFMSQNSLSTATSIVGYDWDYAGKTGRYRLTFKYEGWYPILDFDATFGKQAFSELTQDSASIRYTWDQTQLSSGIKLPLLFNNGKYYTGIQLMAHATWQKISNNTSSSVRKVEGSYYSADYRFLIYHYIKQSLKDVYPQWGQVLDLQASNSPFGESGKVKIGSAETTLFFPGLFRHNGIKFYAAYQKRWDHTYTNNLVNFTRGALPSLDNQLMSFQLNYKFPFLYPDASMGPVAYFKRVKATFFYDHAFVSEERMERQLNSFGAEVSTDFHFLRFLLPLDIGIREGYSPIGKRWFTDFLFLVNLSI